MTDAAIKAHVRAILQRLKTPMVTRKQIEAEAAMVQCLIDEAAEAAAISRGHCPDCDHRGFVLGPKGGAAQNIECGNLQCRARFNVTVYGGRVVFCHRIARESEGGSKWATQ
jgi:hypothetical protein